MLVVLAVGGCLGWWLHLARVQRQAVAAIRAAGGSITYEWDVPGAPSTPGWRRWVAEHVDVDLTSNVVEAWLSPTLRRCGAGPGRTVRPSGESGRWRRERDRRRHGVTGEADPAPVPVP